MTDDCMRGHLTNICYALLQFNEVKVSYSFAATVGQIIGDQGRERIVCILFEELIRLKNNIPTEYYIVADKDCSTSDYRRVLKDSNWSLMFAHPKSSRRKLASTIQEEFFPKFKKQKLKKNNYTIDFENFASVVDGFLDLSVFNQFGIKDLLLEEVKIAFDKNKNDMAKYPDTFLCICEVFQLTKLQRTILFQYYMIEAMEEMDSFVRYSDLDFVERKKAVPTLSKILRVSSTKIKKELRSSSKLAQSMLLNVDEQDINITTHISEFLQDDDEKKDFFSFLFEPVSTEKSLNLRQHRIEKDDIDVLKFLLKSDHGSNILLYGESGTGKTEFSKSVAAIMGVDIYKIKNFDPNEENIIKAKRSALMAAKNILPKKAILVVDEAEVILESGSNIFRKDSTDNKAWLNCFMEEHQINIIWITNDMTMHPSSKRRFDYSLNFESFNNKQRVQALINIQKNADQDIFTVRELESLSKEYPLEPGALNLGFSKLKGSKLKKEAKRKVVNRILKSQLHILKGDQGSEKKIDTFYNPAFINTSLKEEEIINTLKKYYQRQGAVRNLCLLFQGPPGTGKTEYTRYISEKLDKELSVKRASDILSSYWGETEKRMAGMFREAQRNGEILFLDECDSLFRPRSSAEYSWMISQTNELLTQMERFEGVMICATNFIEHLDHAAMRRFHLKVKFDTLRSPDLPAVYTAFFSSLVNQRPEKALVEKLKKLRSLTPGDFKAVYNSVLFRDEITHELIIEKLKEEVSYKQDRGKIGII